MNIKWFGFFGFVVCGTLTACEVPSPSTPLPDDSGTLSVDSGDSGSQNDAHPSSDSDASVPLILNPERPTLPHCTGPFAPVLEAVPAGARLPIFANSSDSLSVGIGNAGAAAPESWSGADSLSFPASAAGLTVFARLSAPDCPSVTDFTQNYSVHTSFAPAAGVSGSSAISKDDPRIAAWATQVLSVAYGDGVTAAWQTPQKALGAATLDTTDVISLGEGGSIALGFDVNLADSDGYDLVVFENGFADSYLELAYVEVSSDGVNFLRFDSASLGDSQVGAYGTLDPTLFEGLAGKYRLGYGTPFDLGWLKSRPEVRSGLVNLARITAVRIVDIVGDGRNRDSFGHAIFDPYPTVGSAGFDLDAVGILNRAP